MSCTFASLLGLQLRWHANRNMSELYCKIIIVSVFEDCLRSFGDRNLPCSVHCNATLSLKLRRLFATKVGRLVVRPMARGGSFAFLYAIAQSKSHSFTYSFICFSNRIVLPTCSFVFVDDAIIDNTRVH